MKGEPAFSGVERVALNALSSARRTSQRLGGKPLHLEARAAFTLLELLVAATITALMAGFIALMVGNVSSTWTRATGRLAADAQARIVLDQLQVDLQGALFREDGNSVWMAIDVLNNATGNQTGLWQTAPRNPKPAGGLSLDMMATRAELSANERGKLEFSRFGTAGVWLRFFTSGRPVTNAGAVTVPSAPVAVGYQIIRRFSATNPGNANTAYLLHRAEVRPAASSTGRPGVLEAGYRITDPAYSTSTAATNNGSETGDPRSIQVPGTARNLDSVIADNVIDFGVRAWVRDASMPGGLRLIFPATNTGALTNSPQPIRAQLPSSALAADPNTNPRFLFPDVVDVMVRILTDQGAEQIANLERNQTPPLVRPQKYLTDQAWWWGVALENSRVYTRRIVLNKAP